MDREKGMERKGKRLMRQAVRQMTVIAGILLAFCVICRLTMQNTYYAVIPLPPADAERAAELRVEAEDPEVVTEGTPVVKDGYLRVPIQPGQKGDTVLNVKDRDGKVIAQHTLKVNRDRTVYDANTGGFTGDTAVMIAFTVFSLALAAIMIWSFRQVRGSDFYDYLSLYFSGFSIFALVTGIVMINLTLRHLVDPAGFSMMNAYSAISSASWHFMLLTSPLVLAFAVAMAVSNIALLRHETPRIQNVLGLGIGILMILGEVIGWLLFNRDLAGPAWVGRAEDTIQNVYATVFVYFECMLAGAVICGLMAPRMTAEQDKDFIIILGCGFRKDGTLPPLLRGRADRAIAFWKKQREETGRTAILIPSGGQGKNESMPEAVAIRRYLLEQGIPEEYIRIEDQSRTTFENMCYSRKIMEELQPDGKVAFATTSYHVFRSGLWAAEAGVRAEGLGSRTKWWFWPNAFMRETLGLLQKRWKTEAVMLVMLIVFFSILSITLG